jgi:flagellar protein FlaG
MLFKEECIMKLDRVDMPLPTKLPDTEISANANNTQKISKEVNDLAENKLLPEAEKKSFPVSEKFIIDTIEKANKAIEGARTEFRFSIHKDTHEIMVRVFNKDSGEVIREIPSQKTLDLVAKMWEMAGIIVDEKR